MEKRTHNEAFESVRQELLDQRIDYLEKGEKRSKDIALISTGVAAVSLLTIIANVMTNDLNVALQTTGSCVAMATYSVGNLKQYKYYKNLIAATKEKKEQKVENVNLEAIKEKLENYKSRLEYYRINHPTHVIAGLGFAESFIMTLINTITTVNSNTAISLVPLVFMSSITGLVALGHIKLATDSKSQISLYKGLVTDTTTELDIKTKQASFKKN